MKLELNQSEAISLAEKQSLKLAENSRITVNSQPTFDKAKLQLVQVKAIKKFVKEKKESITKPLNEALKNARALFKPFEDKVSTIETYLNGEILKYNQKLIAEQKKREEEAEKKLQEEEDKKRKAEEEAEKLRKKQEEKEKAGEKISGAEKKKLEEAEKEASKDVDMDKLTKKMDNTSQKINQIRTRKVKKYKIIDVNKVPRAYLQVDAVLVKEAMMKDVEIDGIEFYTEEVAVNSY